MEPKPALGVQDLACSVSLRGGDALGRQSQPPPVVIDAPRASLKRPDVVPVDRTDLVSGYGTVCSHAFPQGDARPALTVPCVW